MPHHRAIRCTAFIGLLSVAVWLLFIGGCAEVGPPPGGERDVTGPHIVESYPANGALGVVPDSYIRLNFSEAVTRPDKGSVVFISPRPIRPPELKWKSSELLIKLPELFRANQTYVVSISSNVTDLRRNRLDSAATIAFSTGSSLDSGLVAGQVWTPESKTAVGWIVGLYPSGIFDTYQFADSVYPPYMTTVGSDGKFSLRHLPNGSFSLLAFEDRNRDELFNPATEAFAVSDRNIVVGGPLKLDRLNLPGTQFDSLAPGIISVVPNKDRLLRIRLSRKINPSFLALNSRLTTLKPISDSTAPELQCAGFAETGAEPSDVVTLYFPDMNEAIYRLTLSYSAEAPALVRDSVVVKAPNDDAPPEVVAFLPGEKALFVDQIKLGLTMSEPLKQEMVTDQSILLWEGEKRVGCKPIWDDVFHLTLKPDRLLAGKKYRLDVAESDFRDLSNNPLGDSLRSYKFSTLDDDSVGSVTGVLLVKITGKEGQTAILTLQEPAGKQSFVTKVPALGAGHASDQRMFEFKVPPGKYLLSGFLDADGDGRPTPGSIRPFRPAETQANYADTIAVRARFESAGTQFIIE